jgi:phosphoribosylaminoimidazolecarboxamide formyltransferase/IMP cyclohydrolase
LRALLSVATRDGITTFARGLHSLGIEIFATDGTREHLAQDGLEVKPVAELTGVPQMLDGSVKTFHHAIYAGILARRDQPDQLAELKK